MNKNLRLMLSFLILLIFAVSLFGQRSRSRVVVTDKSVSNQPNSLRKVLERDFNELNLSVTFDSSFQDARVDNQTEALKTATRLDLLLKQNGLDIAILEDKRLIVFQDSPLNRVRVEKMEVKKYKLNFLPAENLQSILTDLLPKERRFFHILKGNVLLVTGSTLDHLKIESLVEALDFEPLIITLDINFYEVSGEKQRDLLQGLDLSNYSVNNPLFLLPFSQNSLNDKNVNFIGKVHLPMLNGRASSIKIGQKVPVKTANFYSPAETRLNPTNLAGKLIQAILPNQTADFNSTYIFEDAGLELIATPNLYLDSKGEINLNLTFEFRNQYPEAERVSAPSFRNIELKTTEIMKLNEPALVASWDIERTAKEKRPVLIPFVSLPFKAAKSNRKSLMTLTAKLKNKENFSRLMLKEQELEARLASILSVELLQGAFQKTRP